MIKIADMINKVKVGYVYSEPQGVGIVQNPQMLNCNNIIHCFSTRIGGISASPYDSMDLSFLRHDSIENVRENYRIFGRAMGVDIERSVVVNYCHGDGIVYVTEDMGGCGLMKQNSLPSCDALITDIPNIPLITIHADCTNFMIYDSIHNAVGTCHAGWKGTLLRIGKKTVEAMTEKFGTDPHDCIVGIGPNICADCFEVDKPVADQFISKFDIPAVRKKNDVKYLVDMTMCSVFQFLEAGVLPENITISGECTFSDSKRYFSYRRDGKNAGSMAGLIMLRK